MIGTARRTMDGLALAAAAMVAATPAWAGAGAPIPEAADFALFALGVIGLVVGRNSSRTRHRD